MINTLKIIYKYTERALTPSTFSALIQEKVNQAPLKVLDILKVGNNASVLSL